MKSSTKKVDRIYYDKIVFGGCQIEVRKLDVFTWSSKQNGFCTETE